MPLRRYFTHLYLSALAPFCHAEDDVSVRAHTQESEEGDKVQDAFRECPGP